MQETRPDPVRFLDAAEDIEIVTIPLAEIPARIAAGEVSHALVVAAFVWLLGLRESQPGAPRFVATD